MASESRQCQNCKTQFVIEPEDFGFYEKINVPPPTFCWLCRAQRRMAWRNERTLYKRKSDATGKDIFSAFSSETPVKVYEKDVWISDSWDPMVYGRDYDFSRLFFTQFRDLMSVVPLKNLNIVNGGPDSEFCNNVTDPKNSYMVFNGKGAEDCLYCNGCSYNKDCMDFSHLGKCESCYESFWLTSCSRVFFSSQCEGCYNMGFSKNCTGCHDCLGCVGLKNKSFCMWNEQLTKEEYQKRMEAIDLSSNKEVMELKKKAKDFWQKFPNKAIEGSHNTDVGGGYITHSKNVNFSFLVREGEDLKFCQYVQELPSSKNCYDYTAWGDTCELTYECAACGIGVSNIKFCYNVQESTRDVEYSYMCSGSTDIFGCVGLKKKQHCIFNKQYPKEEYFALVEKIKKHMDAMPYVDKAGRVYKYGEFFPIELSPFAYNATLAQEYFPESEDGAIKKGYNWIGQRERSYVATVKADDLPDKIVDVPDDITKAIINCSHDGRCNEQCTGAFRIVPQELIFYRKLKLPLPRFCPNCRHYQRLEQRNKLNVFERQCMCAGDRAEGGKYQNQTGHFHKESHCPESFKTTYDPKKSDIVYCEQCYNTETS
jgi:hypothetical protein